MEMNGNNEDKVITKASISAWRQSYDQLFMKQRLSIFSWTKTNKNNNNNMNASSYGNDADIDADL